MKGAAAGFCRWLGRWALRRDFADGLDDGRRSRMRRWIGRWAPQPNEAMAWTMGAAAE